MSNATAALADVLERITNNGGFLSLQDVKDLAHFDRLRLVLVRCGNGRFMCPVQDVEHFMAIIDRDADAHHNGCDYIRDISLPASDPVYVR